MFYQCEQGQKASQTSSNTLQIHQIKFNKKLSNLAVCSNEDLRDQEKMGASRGVGGKKSSSSKPLAHLSLRGTEGHICSLLPQRSVRANE